VTFSLTLMDGGLRLHAQPVVDILGMSSKAKGSQLLQMSDIALTASH